MNNNRRKAMVLLLFYLTTLSYFFGVVLSGSYGKTLLFVTALLALLVSQFVAAYLLYMVRITEP